VDKKIDDREYLHSMSRIGDRLKTLKRDLKNFREDLSRDVTDMENDVQMLSDAFDSLFQDRLEEVWVKKPLINV